MSSPDVPVADRKLFGQSLHFRYLLNEPSKFLRITDCSIILVQA